MKLNFASLSFHEEDEWFWSMGGQSQILCLTHDILPCPDSHRQTAIAGMTVY